MAAFMAQLNRFHKDHMAQEAENIYYLAFRKFAMPCTRLNFRDKAHGHYSAWNFPELSQTSKQISIGCYFPIIFWESNRVSKVVFWGGFFK